MNILMLRPQIELGGVTAYIKLLSRGLVAQGHQVRVATGGGALVRSLGEMGLPVATLPLYPSTLPHLTRSALQLRRFVRTHHVDLLHSHHRFTTIVGRFVQRLVRVPLIATIHEFKDDGRLTARLWARNITIVPSQALKDHLVTLFQANAQDIFVIPYGIDVTSRACAVSANPPIAPALRANKLSVGYIGRLSPEKGARYFLESIPLISAHWPNIGWVVVGDGPEALQLRQLADHLGLDAAQIFLGARSDIDALIKTLDIVVIPSLSDNFPMVALEAMRAGRAVVASSVGGLPEAVRDGETGLLVAPESPAALADAVGRLLADPALRDRLGKRGRQVFEQEYISTVMVDRTLAAYRAALDTCKR